MCHLCQHWISISGIKWTVSNEIYKLSGTTTMVMEAHCEVFFSFFSVEAPISRPIPGTHLQQCHQQASAGSISLFCLLVLHFMFCYGPLSYSIVSYLHSTTISSDCTWGGPRPGWCQITHQCRPQVWGKTNKQKQTKPQICTITSNVLKELYTQYEFGAGSGDIFKIFKSVLGF